MYPEVYELGRSNVRWSRIHEFDLDDSIPPFNCLVMWEPPQRGFVYTVGVDPAWGLEGLDRSVIHVLRNGTMHTSDKQVAEFVTDDINMHDLAPICNLIGRMYSDQLEQREALMSVECNISDTVVHDLRTKYNYGNLFIWKFYDSMNMLSRKLGWWTTARTRPKLINKTMQYTKHGWWDVSSPWLIAEMETIEKSEDKAQIKAAGGLHDDMFMAGAIALWSAHDMEFNTGDTSAEVAQKRELRFNERMAAQIQVPVRTGPNQGKTFQNSECTVEDMDNMVGGLL